MISFLNAAFRVLTDCRHGLWCSWHLTLKNVLNVSQCYLAGKCREVLMAGLVPCILQLNQLL